MSELTKRLRERIISESVRDFDTGELKMREAQDPLAVEAADRIEALEECLRELVADITDSEHSPHDWSEQVVVKQARALLGEK